MRDFLDSQLAGLDTQLGEDLSTLAWVHTELRRSLESANKSLRRYLKDSEAASAASDLDAVDVAMLRSARAQLHQGVGALELVGLPAAATVLRAGEGALQRLVAKPALVNARSVDVIEKLAFGLLDYVARLLGRKSVSPLMLFPQYREAQQLAGADRVHPADLWQPDWRWRELPHDPKASPRNADEDARSEMEAQVLALMREPGGATERIGNLCADLGAGARLRGQASEGSLWQLAAAVFEAQQAGLLAPDAYAKRLVSRLLAQLRGASRGSAAPSERLAQDLLFFCARAQAPAPGQAPRLEAVRQAWRLPDAPLPDYESTRLGRFDPALLAQARKRVASAKESWSGVAGGELHRLPSLTEQMHLVGESLHKLFPSGDVLAAALEASVAKAVVANQAPAAALAMEVATGILFLDATLEDAELDQPQLPGRLVHLAQRIDAVRAGAQPQPLESWMEELYRRVSDRQTMGSVVAELRASLSDVEKHIDQFFRNPADRQALAPVPAQLGSMRGVLSVLGMDEASRAVQHMRDSVLGFAQPEPGASGAEAAQSFERLADNLGALSFLIDMLSVQPQLAKNLFHFDADSGMLSAVMGRLERSSGFAALDQPTLPMTMAGPAAAQTLMEQVRALASAAADTSVGDEALSREAERLAQLATAADQRELAQGLSDAHRGLRPASAGGLAQADPARSRLRRELAALGRAATPALPLPDAKPVPPPRPAQAGGTGLEDDAEMREIFIEEAREVVGDARAALQRLRAAADSLPDLTTVRRGFHTLKGSSRMVGLKDFGEAAWSCEQLYNARLASDARLDDALALFTDEALDYLGDWIEAIAESQSRGHESTAITQAADALRLQGRRVAIARPTPGVPTGQASEALAAEPAPAAAEAAVAAHPEGGLSSTPPADAEPLSVGEATLIDGTDFFGAGERTELLPQGAPRASLGQQPWPGTADAAAAAPAAAAQILPTLSLDLPPELSLALSGERTDERTDEFSDEPSEGPTEGPVAERAPDFARTSVLGPLPARSEPSALDLRVTDLPSAEDLDLSLGDAPELSEWPLDALPELIEPGPDIPPALPAQGAAPGAAFEGFALDLAELDEALAAPGALPPTSSPDPEALPLPELQDVLEVPELQDVVDTPAPAAAAEAPPSPPELLDEEEPVKLIGGLRIPIPLFNIYLNEADELSRRLVAELAEWSLDSATQPVTDKAVALAHSLAGSSATVGYAELSALARSLEHALMRSAAHGCGQPGEPELFSAVADEIRRLLHQFAAGFLRTADPGLSAQLAEHERWPAPPEPLAPAPAEARPSSLADLAPPGGHGRADLNEADDIDAVDLLDPELFPIFQEEADELLPQLQQRLREWYDHPHNPGAPAACMRTLHTFKGGARLAGAMRLGEMAHRLETAIEALMAVGEVSATDVAQLVARADAMSSAYEQLGLLPSGPQAAPSPPPPALATASAAALPADGPALPAVPALPVLPELQPLARAPLAGALDAPAPLEAPLEVPIEGLLDASLGGSLDGLAEGAAPAAAALPPQAPSPARASDTATPEIDWTALLEPATPAVRVEEERAALPAAAAVRVRSSLLDRLVNNAGEVAITRSRIEGTVGQLQASLGELTESLERMRRQLRDIELQAETQIAARVEAAKSLAEGFDPLEMDRFTRFQELTRFMAESVNDVATLQRSLQRALQSAEDELAAQARLTRELQDDLLRTRMVEFESAADRLYRCVRQAAKETAKQVRLDIVGGGIELDRGVLERMTGSFEHLLRNSVAHGVELPAQRVASGKEATGQITVTLAQSGNEVAVEFADDGAGLDHARIRRRAVERGLIQADAQLSDDAVAELIFAPGFSTAETVTELAGRGVGLDVVRAEVQAMGGRVQIASTPGAGTRFRLLLPLTTAVTQVVMLRCGSTVVAVPSPLVETVRRVPTPEVEAAYASGQLAFQGESLSLFWLADLLQGSPREPLAGRSQAVVIVRSAAQRVAVHVDEVVGNQEVVVKNVGRQLARLPGLAGVTLLPSGAVALIYNPVALATVYAGQARQAAELGSAHRVAGQARQAGAMADAQQAPQAPLVLVVDDSLTVRRVTQRLLAREGYRVSTAKDGQEALERLADERPAVLLSDIEMPRMDGFDLLRNVRANPRLAGLPVVMITSRTAQKHRDYAAELGADHYLGKPFAEDELLGLIAEHVARQAPVSAS